MQYPSGKYEPFMIQYERTRNENVLKSEDRKAEIYARIPRLKELHDQMASGAISYARARLSGEGCAFDSLDAFLQSLKEEEAALLLTNGYAADSFEPIYTCKKCRDTGFINGMPCSCLKQKMIQTFYMQSNIQKNLETENFEHFSFDYYNKKPDGKHALSQYDYMKAVLAKAKDYVNHFSEKGGNLIFYGPTSLGKTYLSNCIAKELLDQGYSVLYMTATRLFDQLLPNVLIKKTYSAEEMNQYEYLFQADLLIIDDLGTEFITDFTRPQLYQCINERLLSDKATIISTNMQLEDLRDVYDERLSARIIERYTGIPFYGDNVRHKKKKMMLSGNKQ